MIESIGLFYKRFGGFLDYFFHGFTSKIKNALISMGAIPPFTVHRGLRQGEPLSPILCNLVADCLNHMIQRAIHGNYLRGLGPPIRKNQQIVNMHYADDTIFFSQADNMSLNNGF